MNRTIVPILLLAFASTVGGFATLNSAQRRKLQVDSCAASASTLEDTATENVVGDTATRDLPLVLQQIADERHEFQMNLGKAMDTLRKDYPFILTKAPGR